MGLCARPLMAFPASSVANHLGGFEMCAMEEGDPTPLRLSNDHDPGGGTFGRGGPLLCTLGTFLFLLVPLPASHPSDMQILNWSCAQLERHLKKGVRVGETPSVHDQGSAVEALPNWDQHARPTAFPTIKGLLVGLLGGNQVALGVKELDTGLFQLHLSAVKLAELHSDLKIQEKDELQWKKLKAEGLDEDGEKEAKLRRNLDVILAKYGMNGKKDAPPGATNYIKDGLEEEDLLDDPRLVKLWNKAKSSGKFSEEELEKLWREFRHHKEKVHEYNILMEAISRTEDLHKNMITALEDEAEDVAETSPFKEERLHRKHSELKEKLHSINQGFERLRRVTHQGFDADSEFQEPRVIDLWDMAKSTNFTQKELESLREELKHFEAKVEKHLHFQKQLEISHQKLKHVEGTGEREHLTKHREKHSALEEKTKDLGYKVKKHLQDISSRISRGLQHNEL
ncbi:alpha-2-macroglobulin receptor-associated protein [Sceloporus undulatus]|uniref:alpha-2-macroglobulin receptor-associated protein n=1 Tax=Sceloporus undulatus TaxID=8520 RepID=UPI001C4DD59B|nr:alpha-2-macroglobulin receptor-associated protein [Sceloporus undulatus]